MILAVNPSGNFERFPVAILSTGSRAHSHMAIWKLHEAVSLQEAEALQEIYGLWHSRLVAEVQLGVSTDYYTNVYDCKAGRDKLGACEVAR